MNSMTLLEFARGPALTCAVFIFVAGVLWRGGLRSAGHDILLLAGHQP